MTPDKLVEELDARGQGARAQQHLGAADPQPHRHARHRDQEPRRHQGSGRRPGDDRPADDPDRIGGARRTGRLVRARRTADRRPLHRRRRRPRRGGALRPDQWRTCSRSSRPRSAATTSARSIEGRERYPINVRYPREIRDSLEKLRELPFVTDKGAQLLLQDVARVSIDDGPPMLRSENARLSGWIYVDVRGRDLRSVVTDMQAAVAKAVKLPPGYAVSWSGQFEYLERATERLKLVVPLTLGRHLRAAVPAVPLLRAMRRWSWRRCRSRSSAASGSCGCSATRSRSPRQSASSRSPGSPPSSAWSCSCT